MVVPTMLARIIEHRSDDDPGRTLPTPAHTSPTAARRCRRRSSSAPCRLFPDVDFVNAYGLTETSSTIAVLGPDDHRAALASADPVAHGPGWARSAGPCRASSSQIRDGDGAVLPPAGSATSACAATRFPASTWAPQRCVDADGWFATRDRGWIDADGYLFIEGRADDTIIRGGENLAPAEIEDVLLDHPAVADAAVVGVPDEQWGQHIAAVIVARPGHPTDASELRSWVRSRLRGAKTPALIVFRDSLPHTPTGKLLRREVLADLLSTRP